MRTLFAPASLIAFASAVGALSLPACSGGEGGGSGGFGAAMGAGAASGMGAGSGVGTGSTGAGAAPGTGGAQGTGGGSLGTGGDGTGGGGTVGGGCEAADILCEPFDNLPTGPGWTTAACPGAGYNIAIKDGALETTGGNGNNGECVPTYDLGGRTDFWVAARIQITGKQLTTEHEVTFFEIGELIDQNDPELRIGYRGDNSCTYMSAVYAGFELGATKGMGGEATGCTGVVPTSGKWYCLEVHVTPHVDGHESELFADGTKLDTVIHGNLTEKVKGLFQPKYLKVGMQSYSGGGFDGLLVDSVSVSTTQIGCGTP